MKIEKQQKKSENTAQIPIDNRGESTYSVINKRPMGLSTQEEAVWALLGTKPELIDSIMDRTDLPASAVQTALTRLTIKGIAVQHPDGRVSRK